MKINPFNKKKTLIAAAVAIPAILVAIFIPKVVKAKKRGRYASN